MMEDGAGIPEEFRCKRSDGKQWRCSARSMPDKTVCEKHYVQAKRRAANSAMRASEKKARRKMVSNPGEDGYLEEDLREEASVSPIAGIKEYSGGGEYSGGPSPVKRFKVRMKGAPSRARHGEDAERDLMQDGLLRDNYSPLKTRKSTKSLEDYSSRSTDSSVEVEGLTCHQCQRDDRVRVAWCSSCDKRGYCEICALRRYPNIPIEDIRQVCPACRGICNCRKCLRGDNLIKARIQEMSSMEKIRHLHRLLSFLLPVLKRIHSEQCHELDLEIRVHGIKSDIPRAKLQPDEQMCCDSCRMPILDYHRHCANCEFDLCLMCCQDLRRASHSNEFGGRMIMETSEIENCNHTLENQTSDCDLEFLHYFPKWRANNDGSIPCPRSESVAGCRSPLVLRRIFKINWVARLVKHTEEMVNGCKVSNLTSDFQSSNSENFFKCSQRVGSSDNFLYCPPLRDIEDGNIGYFHRHWEMGEPVIVKDSFEPSLSACWDPMSIWRGIQEMTDERIKEDDVFVRAVNCMSQSEVDIELRKFIKRYTNGCIDKHGSLKVLKLKDWPSENDVEEFLLCQRPEFLRKLPLLEYFHPKWGFLNLSAKLPRDSSPRDAGPKFLIACGASEEHENVYILNLRISMADVVYLLMHTSENKFEGRDLNKVETISKDYDEMESSSTNNRTFRLSLNEEDDGDGFSQKGKREFVNGLDLDANVGAIWDVFRRQDVPKLNKYLRDHWDDLKNPVVSSNDSVPLPLYEQGVVLDGHHKRRLKEELGIEPWTFEQHIGEAVFIPAGCPFQVRNRQSTVHLCVDFLSPESLLESARIAQEIRSLPSYHEAKLQMLEVGKMCLYAASSSIRYIQRIVLDPKLFSEVVFEDRNLTAAVSENLARVMKRRQIACL